MRPVISCGLVGQLEAQLRVREQRREVLELHAVARLVGRHAVDLVDAQQRRVLLVARLRTRRAVHVVALAQREATHLRRRHVDVLRAGQVAAAAEEAVALVAEVEQTLHRDRLALEVLLARLVAAAARLPPLAAAAAPAAATATVAVAEPVAVTDQSCLVLVALALVALVALVLVALVLVALVLAARSWLPWFWSPRCWLRLPPPLSLPSPGVDSSDAGRTMADSVDVADSDAEAERRWLVDAAESAGVRTRPGDDAVGA